MANMVGRWISATQTCRLVRTVERCSLQGRFEVKNNGNKTARSERVAISLSHDGELDTKDSLLKTYTLGSIAAGQTRVVTVSIPRLPFVFHPATVFGKVDATNVIAESAEGDNLAKIEVR
jgi:subtilase family serine protease